ncbi:DUF3560 domain-containing protein [Streptomyces sp. NBC_00474]|uniref:DUF3560 domain-containing protein n=1 Tax=Streptomyces sp. NBC_00474 TaxID=2975754 RepID=UPI0022507050|nr:DUF3560 domain-containing protein [Streptomyces sp. NBC_00474]
MSKGLKRVTAAYERGNAAQVKAEAARERARVAAGAEDERISARVSYADALVSSLPFGSADRGAAVLEWLSARFDLGEGAASGALAECEEYAARVEASASEGWADDDRKGWDDAHDAAKDAHKETMIEFGTFERHDHNRGVIVLPSLYDAESAWEIIAAHSRDMARLVRESEAAADAAEADAQQCEEWADAAESAENDDTADALTLFAMGTPDVRHVDMARAHWGVTDTVAENWAADAVAVPVVAAAVAAPRGIDAPAGDAPAVTVPVEAPRGMVGGRTADEWASVTDDVYGRAYEAYETSHQLMTYTRSAYEVRPVDCLSDEDAARVRAAFKRLDRLSSLASDVSGWARWDVIGVDDRTRGSVRASASRARDCARRVAALVVGCEREARVIGEAFAHVDTNESQHVVTFAPVADQDCDTAESAPVADAPAPVAPAVKVPRRRVTLPEGGGVRWAAYGPKSNAQRYRVEAYTVPGWLVVTTPGGACLYVAGDDVAREAIRAHGYAVEAARDEPAARAVSGEFADRYSAPEVPAGDVTAEGEAYAAVMAECHAHVAEISRMGSVDRMERGHVVCGHEYAREVADMAQRDVRALMTRAAEAEGTPGGAALARGEVLPLIVSAREAVEAYDAHRAEETREHELRAAAEAGPVRVGIAPRAGEDSYSHLGGSGMLGSDVLRRVHGDQGAPVAAATVAERLAVLPDVVSDPGAVDAWETDGGAVTAAVVICQGKGGGVFPPAFRGPYEGTVRVSREWLTERARRALAVARERLTVAEDDARECAAWRRDAYDLHQEVRRSAGVLGEHVWVRYETSGQWSERAREASYAADARRTRARDAVRWRESALSVLEREAEEPAQRAAAARGFLARAAAGDVPAGRGAWVSEDGGTAVMFELPADAEYAPDMEHAPGMAERRAFVDLLADAVAARDEGRVLKGPDLPTKNKHGRTAGVEKGQASASVKPLVQPWKAHKGTEAGRMPAVSTLEDWQGGYAGAEVIAETEAAPGVWLPMAAVAMADTAAGNGWTVAVQRSADGVTVTVRAAGTATGKVPGEMRAVWSGGLYDVDASGAWVNGAPVDKTPTLHAMNATVAQVCKVRGVLVEDTAPVALPDVVSDLGGVDGWESDGGAVERDEHGELSPPAVRDDVPASVADDERGPLDGCGYPQECRHAWPCGRDEAVWSARQPKSRSVLLRERQAVTRARKAAPDVVSDPSGVDVWEADGGMVPGVETLAPVAAAVADMPIAWATLAGRGDCAAANTCGGFGVLLWDVPGCAPRCAECAARVMGHTPAALRALTLPGDVVEAEEEAEAADIVIRHTHEEGTTVEGSSRGDGVWDALRPLGWTYRRAPGIFIRGSRYKGADRWKINRAADAVRALGLTCAVVIEETMSFAEREAARVDAAEERTERFADRAGRAAASSQSARDASDRIGERFWMGQPILVGHHSEGRARRDQERMHNAMRKSIAEGERAGYWASRAAAADAYERYRNNPGRTLRRIDKLEAERRGVLRERDGVDDKGRTADVWRRKPSEARHQELTRRLAEYDEELTYWAETIKEAERRGFKVWGRADFVKGDFMRWRGSWYEVTRVNAKTVTVPHIHAAFDGGTAGAVGGCRVVTRAATAETRHKGSTYTLPYNEVSGRMSAEQMRAALAGEAIPVDSRDPAPAEDGDGQAPAYAPDAVSDPSGPDVWESEGGAVPGVEAPRLVADPRELPSPAISDDASEAAPQCARVLPAGLVEARAGLPGGVHVVELMTSGYGRARFGVECTRCGPMTVALPVDTFDPFEAGEAARAHWDERHRPVDDGLTDAEVAELDAWPLSKAQYGVLVDIDMHHSYEWADGFWSLDVNPCKFDVSRRHAKGRVVRLWAAGLVSVYGEGAGSRVLRLSEEGRRVVWLWFRARRQGVAEHAERDAKLSALPERSGRYPLLSEGRYFKGEERPEDDDQSAAEVPAFVADVVSDPSGPDTWEGEGGALADAPEAAPAPVVALPAVPLMLEAAPVRLALPAAQSAPLVTRVRAEMEAERAAKVVTGLGWSRQFADVVALADRGRLYEDGDGTYRTIGALGRKGKPVRADRVRMLADGGFVVLASSGMVEATDDGREVLRLAGLAPECLHADDRTAHAARFAAAKRERGLSNEDCKSRARRLAPLPGGVEDARRRAASRRWLQEWERETRASREASARRIAQEQAQEAQDVYTAQCERETAAERACRDCAGTYPVEARCGACRDRAAMGLPLWDGLALPPVPLPVICAGVTGVLPVPEIVAAGVADEHGGLWLVAPDNTRLGTVQPDGDGEVRALLTGQPVADEDQEQAQTAADVVSDPAAVDGWEGDGGACPEVAVPPVDGAWRHPRGGTASPALPALPLSREVIGHGGWESGERGTRAGPAGCPTYASVAGRSDSLDVFAALDAELEALAADWDSVTA